MSDFCKPLIFMILLLIFHDVTVATLPYVPLDNITIDCGSSGSKTALDHRIWEGDINSKYSPTQTQNNASIFTYKSVQPPTTVYGVPYQTARLSRSEFTYSLPVTPGQKFIRLHFYPSLYRDFDTTKAFFSVQAAHFTLLTNFSPFLNSHALNREAIVKEFCLNIEEDKSDHLSITFTPSSNSQSFAFINGIELLSMPNNLYYSETKEQDYGENFVGQNTLYPIKVDTAMEMSYRINVGGSFISPADDTGMFRSWDEEGDYLTIPGYSVLPVEYKHNLSFKRIPAYTAPANVYRTARSTGNIKDKALLHSYNLTWEFPVDSRFYYLVRLHFCEIVPEMKISGDRVFYIYIANETADSNADVIMWSGGNSVPVYRDYVVAMFGQGDGKKVNLSVALQVNPDEWRTSYLDAILNGIEIFKLNDSSGNLAGPNPDLPISQYSSVAPPRETQRKEKNCPGPATIIGIFCGIGSGVVVLVIGIGFLIFSQRRKVVGRKVNGTIWKGDTSFSTTKSTKTSGSSLPSDQQSAEEKSNLRGIIGEMKGYEEDIPLIYYSEDRKNLAMSTNE
nr:receptor-like protein kinase FERONIA [Ziziphus jujuba var. spinosa]